MNDKPITIERIENALHMEREIARAVKDGKLSLDDLVALRAAIYARKIEDKNPGRWGWDAWPQGWMKYKAWSRRSIHRTHALRQVQKHIALAKKV